MWHFPSKLMREGILMWWLIIGLILFSSMFLVPHQLILKNLRKEKLWQMNMENHRWNCSVWAIYTEKPHWANPEKIIKLYLMKQTAGLVLYTALEYCGVTRNHVYREQVKNMFKVQYEYFLQSFSVVSLLWFLPFSSLSSSKCNWQSIINWLESWN